MGRIGFSRKTATDLVGNCSGDTIPVAIGASTARQSLSVQAKKLFCEQMPQTPCLFGGTLPSAETVKKALNAPSSATRDKSGRLTLSAKQTQLLMSSGLIAGITPSFVRKTSGLAIRDFASLPLDGGDAE